MDFMGFRELEKEPWVSDDIKKKFFRSMRSLIYDARFRRGSDLERRIAITHGFLVASRSLPLAMRAIKFNHPVRILSDYITDESKMMGEIVLTYHTCEPRSLPIKDSRVCNICAESFHYWMACKLTAIRLCNHLPTYTIEYQDALDMGLVSHIPNIEIWTRPLLDIFISIPPEIVHTNSLTTLALPLITNLQEFLEATLDWVAFMGWWRLINQRILPIYCTLREWTKGLEDEPKSSKLTLEVVQHNLQMALRDCYNYMNALKIKKASDLNKDEIEDLYLNHPVRAIHMHKVNNHCQRLINDLLVFSVHTARAVVNYLLELRKTKESKQKLDVDDKSILSNIGLNVKNLTMRVRKIPRGLTLVDVSDVENLFRPTIGLIGKLLNDYHDKKLFSKTLFGDDMEVQICTLQRVQKFICRLIGAANYAGIDYFSKLIKEKLPYPEIFYITHQVTVFLSWNSMLGIMRPIYESQNKQLPSRMLTLPDEGETYETLNFVRDSTLRSLQKIVVECTKVCASSIFFTKPEKTRQTDLPLCILQNDFDNFLRGYSRFYHRGPQPLMDIDFITNRRLLDFMKEMYINFIKVGDDIDSTVQCSAEMLHPKQRRQLSPSSKQKSKKGSKQKKKWKCFHPDALKSDQNPS